MRKPDSTDAIFAELMMWAWQPEGGKSPGPDVVLTRIAKVLRSSLGARFLKMLLEVGEEALTVEKPKVGKKRRRKSVGPT